MIRVLLADDQALVRAGFRVLIDSEEGFAVVGEAADGGEAVELTVAHRPDVVLMDIRMPGMDGIEATRCIVADERTAETRILVLTTFDLDEYVFRALRAGASGFLLKDTQPAELLAGIRVVAAGEALLAPSVTRTVIAQFAATPDSPAKVDDRVLGFLTDREREVLTLIGRGLSNTEIAQQLVIGAATMKTHVSRILSKLNARDRAQLVVTAYETGLVTPGSEAMAPRQP
jgi:DNA-binding NarL/FixJ family response regulator